MPEPKDFCFVVIFFEDPDGVYEYMIKPAVEESGILCLRGDQVPGGGNVLRDIVESICRARVIVVDVGGDRQNVYYELGLAHCLNPKVIMVAKAGTELPFDLKTYRVIFYETTPKGQAQFKTSLTAAVREILEGPDKKRSPVCDFLSPEFMPVNADQHRILRDELELTRKELTTTREKSLRTETDLKNSEEKYHCILEEHAQLKGIQRVMEPLMSAILGTTKMNDPDLINKLESIMNGEGDVTVPIPQPVSEKGKVIPLKKEKQFIFKKISK